MDWKWQLLMDRLKCLGCSMEANQEGMIATISTIQFIQTKFKETISKEMEGVLASVK
jgi:hypothetical protein